MVVQPIDTKITLTPAEAARRLGLGLDYIYLLIWSGKLEARKRDGRWQIPLSAIEQRLKTQGRRDG